MINLELLNRVWKQIETHPDTWDQQTWLEREPCGTTGCVAGWAAMLSGWEPDFDPDEDEYATTGFVKRGGESDHVDVVAARELGLSYIGKDWLFHSSRTMDQIQGFVERANETGDPLP